MDRVECVRRLTANRNCKRSRVNQAVGVRITRLTVPSAVINGSEGIDIQCDYRLSIGDSGLVLKWFLNGNPQPVYQWIHGKHPQLMGELRHRFSRSSRGPNAVHILNPTTDLAGEYQCLVSTFRTEDYSSKTMVVFVPEREMSFEQIYHEISGVDFCCKVSGIYPEPVLILYRELREIKVPLKMVAINKTIENGLYTLVSKATLQEEELYTTTVIFCELQIPGTNYTKQKTSVYYSGRSMAWIDMASDSSTLNLKIFHFQFPFYCTLFSIMTSFLWPGHCILLYGHV
ncbi:uncharacterized protein LOC111055930 isoform X2 [Nilaparvata lugens]|uniref:uncharacterized protein LOC111055930 isoform X2 n=1 Tax=Nilaparvata lugens TaxID=108931 RepID=UPI00193DB4D4|nr:uncharacterized protein LOC111055930 isoform X2 [Nilaparvata lugens]